MTADAAEREKLIDQVKGLYRRLAAGTLTADDTLDAGHASFPDLSGFMTRIHEDTAVFEKHFAAFADTYDVFRVFGAEAVILDVGAHWGYSALAMRRRGAMAKVFSIEAMPHNARVLAVLKRLEQGRYDYVENAATERAGDLTFYIPAMNGVANTGSASTGGTLSDPFAFILADLAAVNPAPPGQPNRTQLVVQHVVGKPIDTIAADAGLTRQVEAMKMDVEGHEASALRGAASLIEQQRPLIMVEGANLDPGVVSVLVGLGYTHYERHGGQLVPHDGPSDANDGFWLHPSKVSVYASKGLMA